MDIEIQLKCGCIATFNGRLYSTARNYRSIMPIDSIELRPGSLLEFGLCLEHFPNGE